MKQNKLTLLTILGTLFLDAALVVMLFLPARTFDYWQGWLCLASFSLSQGFVSFYFLFKDPELVARRIKAGPVAEKQISQKIIQSLTQVLFVLPFVISSLNQKYHWCTVPIGLVIAGNVMIVLGMYIVFLVFRENSFASAIIEVGEGQKVISTGPYSVIRHPMYAGAMIMMSGIPLALACWYTLAFVIMLLTAIVWRLLDEEKFLSENLSGYTEYCARIRYRLIPRIW